LPAGVYAHSRARSRFATDQSGGKEFRVDIGHGRQLVTQMNRASTDAEYCSRAALEFHGNERHWRELFEHNPAMYFMVDASGIVLSVNAFGASQLGYAASELVGQSVLNLVFEEDDKEFVRRKMSLCLETPERSNSWEVRKRRKDGTMLWIRETARAMWWSPNQLIMLIACEDISERYSGALESAQLAALVSSSDDVIVSKALDGTITSWNAGATNILGYQADEMIGQPITRIIPPELHQEEKQILARLHRGERIQHYETVRLAKNGRRVDISLTVSPLFNQSGKVVGASKVARDITERKLAEQALRETAARLRTVTETAVDGVILIDARGVVLMFNPACEKLFGYSADTVIGENVKMLMPQPYRHEHDRYITNYRDTRDPKIIGSGREVIGLRKDGSTFPIDLSVGEATQDGESIFVGIIRDITKRKLAEQALRETAARLRTVTETAVDGVILIDARGMVLMFNPACEKLFGYSADTVIGENVKMLMPQPYRHEHDRYITNYRDTRDPKIIGNGREVIGLRKDGSTFPMDLSVGEARQDGESIFVGIIRDLTSRKRTETELEQARAELVRVARVTALGELTAAIAHEVNQPLTGLVSSGNACLRWLAGDVPDLKAARESVERMISAGSRAGEVIRRIRALVGKAPPLRDRLNINDAITEVIALIRGEIQRNHISLRTKLSTEVPLVLGDRIQLQQVILNLILNAMEAMSDVSPQPRELWVSSAKDGPNGALVSVRDSGTGLDGTVLDRLFEAFYTTKAHGMGIGLAVSRTIIQAHGGRLWAAPNVPQGAIFQFTLPADGEEMS
jgi:two-component system sensor kinase FixL